MTGPGRSGTSGASPDVGTDETAGFPANLMEVAAEILVRRQYGEWHPHDEDALRFRLETEPDFAAACRQLEAASAALESHAQAPAILDSRRGALEVLRRRTNAAKPVPAGGRWRMRIPLAAAALCAAAVGIQLSPLGFRPGEYRTPLHERRIVTLDDGSHIALDAATRLQVRYTDDARIVRLREGQAQFSVARDPQRPFKVQAGEHTIVALGTLFTVEYVGDSVNVAMMEGRVVVVPTHDTAGVPAADAPERGRRAAPAAAGAPIELAAGEGVRIGPGHENALPALADLEAATAWMDGRIIFRDESLQDAVMRFNRYSSTRIEIADPALASRRISGVFDAGDVAGFVTAMRRYLNVAVDETDARVVRIRRR